MTEEEWLACNSPDAMLDVIQRMAGSRKLRLIACACCRLLWTDIPAKDAELLAFAERHADEQLKNEKGRLPFKITQLAGTYDRHGIAQRAAFRYERIDLLREAILLARQIVVSEAHEAHFGHLHKWQRDEMPYEAFQAATRR